MIKSPKNEGVKKDPFLRVYSSVDVLTEAGWGLSNNNHSDEEPWLHDIHSIIAR